MTVEAVELSEIMGDLRHYADRLTSLRRQEAIAREIGGKALDALKQYGAAAEQNGRPLTYVVRPKEDNSKLLVVNQRLGGYGGHQAEGSREVTAGDPFEAQDIDGGQIDMGQGELVESLDFSGPKVPVPKLKRVKGFRFEPMHTGTMWRLQVPLSEISGITVAVKLGDEIITEWPSPLVQ